MPRSGCSTLRGVNPNKKKKEKFESCLLMHIHKKVAYLIVWGNNFH